MTCLDLDDTIAALASAPGGALRGIVRLSGPRVSSILERLGTAGAAGMAPPARRARCWSSLLHLPPPWGEVPALVYHWPEGTGYTRQESAELHVPGAPPLSAAVLERVCCLGARLARPGEFTLRAFLAGRLDLTQAEAVLGTIQAQTPQELQAALRQLAGGLAKPLAELREQLLDLLAHLEAGLDFAEEDIPPLPREMLLAALDETAGRLEALARQLQTRSRSDLVPRVVLLGRPNAGKSSLLNALAGQEAALVAPQAGTTRDAVTWRARWASREVLLCDTAGLDRQETADPLAQAAEHATLEQLAEADLVLWCRDRSRPDTPGEQRLRELITAARKPWLLVWTKGDLPAADHGMCPEEGLVTSSRTGQGIAALREAIRQQLEVSDGVVSAVATTAERARESLATATRALARAREAAWQRADELVAAELRIALEAVGEVTGHVYTEDILDRVFQRFCIGK